MTQKNQLSSNYEQESWIVVGAGLCGLATCLELEKQGHACLLMEESPQIGGKLKTEIFEDSYLLDHGFQVLLPSYSELQRNIDLKSLKLKYFNAGAMIRSGSDWIKIADPLRDPLALWSTLFAKIGSFKDKLLVMKLRLSVLRQADEMFFEQSLGSSYDYLRSYGFSSEMIENFWSPFFSGIFLESELKTEAAFLRFLFKMFSLSPVAVPEEGIGQLPQFMFSKLKKTTLHLNTSVQSVTETQVTLSSGKTLQGPVIDTRPSPAKDWGAVSTIYYAAKKSPMPGPWLLLNSRKNKCSINHVAVMSEVSQKYARRGDSLISVNLLQPKVSTQDLSRVSEELSALFGPEAKKWRFLKSFEIEKALPLYLTLPEGKNKFNTPSQQGAFLRAQNLIKAKIR